MVPRSTGYAKGGVLHPPFTRKHPPFVPRTSLVMCRGLWYQVSCVSMQVDVCFHTVCLFSSTVAHFEATPFPLSSSSTLCFPLQYVPMKGGWDLSKPILSSVWLVSFFFCCFFLVGCHRDSLSPDTPVVLKISKQVARRNVVFSDDAIHVESSALSVFASWCGASNDVNHITAILQLVGDFNCLPLIINVILIEPF